MRENVAIPGRIHAVKRSVGQDSPGDSRVNRCLGDEATRGFPSCQSVGDCLLKLPWKWLEALLHEFKATAACQKLRGRIDGGPLDNDRLKLWLLSCSVDDANGEVRL